MNEEQKQQTNFEEWLETHLFLVLVVIVMIDVLVFVLLRYPPR